MKNKARGPSRDREMAAESASSSWQVISGSVRTASRVGLKTTGQYDSIALSWVIAR